MVDDTTAQMAATRADIARQARTHYLVLSDAACHYLSTIPSAIDAWEREPTVLARLAAAEQARDAAQGEAARYRAWFFEEEALVDLWTRRATRLAALEQAARAWAVKPGRMNGLLLDAVAALDAPT